MGNNKNNAPKTLQSFRGNNNSDKNKSKKIENTIDRLDLEKDFLNLTDRSENSFPIQIFPKSLQEIIFEFSDVYQFSLDYLAAGILSTCSTAIGNTHKIQVKKGWVAKCNLYMVIVGKPGDAKTPSLNLCYKPIREREEKLFEDYEEKVKELKSQSEFEKAKQLQYKRFLVNDFTPEALNFIHFNNPRGLCIYVDEIIGFFKKFDRYSKAGEEQNYLSYWSGTVVTQDRVTGTAIRLKDPFINIVGTTQISRLKEFGKGGRTDNGFLDRFLFVYPDNSKTRKWNTIEVRDEIVQNYFNIISNLMDLKFEEANPKIISLTNDAREYLFSWKNHNGKSLIFLPDEPAMKTKLEMYVIRFSLIIQLLFHFTDDKPNTRIDLFAIKGGIELYDYFFKNAVKIREEIVGKDYYDNLTELQKTILNELPDDKSFTTQEGIKIACREINGKPRISSRRFKSYLTDRKLFKKLKRGHYEKLA